MQATLGHNIDGALIDIEVRLFNSITRFANGQGACHRLTILAGTSVGELADRLQIPRSEIFLVLVNGRDITPGLVGDAIKDGDVVAFSGAVPYSYGYGSPVV